MKIQIMCSSCGHRSLQLSYDQYSGTEPPEEFVKAGWNSFGDAFYCRKCSKTWEERNGKDRPLWGEAHTKERIYQTMVNDLLNALDRVKQGKESEV